MPNVSEHSVFMNIAYEISRFSYAERKKVGAILVKDGSIIGFGYNGTPAGYYTNVCEKDNVTIDEVLHAETNLLSKVCKSTISSEGSILYTTLSPCFECSKMIYQAGIKEVYYSELYRDTKGIDFLAQLHVACILLK
jgi:dCMP deaminase